GGLLESAVQIAGKFTPEGTIIAFTETRYGKKERKYFTAHGKIHHENLPLVILINRNSASGAEIVAGALKDLRRAVLIGERSFGKGSVQSVQAVDITIDPPVGIRLTTAKYYTPSARVIHKKGIEPDIPMTLTQEETDKVLFHQTTFRLPPDEQAKIPASNDRQIERARIILQGLLLNAKTTVSHAPAPQR
ncbi:MAG: S41 family peptidase, partial [Verrucomicrobiota bacterium]